MSTRKTTLPKRCLKFEGYIYLPNKNADRKELRYHTACTPGRLKVFDEYGNKTTKKDYAFLSLSEAMNIVEKIKKKIIYKRVKRK